MKEIIVTMLLSTLLVWCVLVSGGCVRKINTNIGIVEYGSNVSSESTGEGELDTGVVTQVPMRGKSDQKNRLSFLWNWFLDDRIEQTDEGSKGVQYFSVGLAQECKYALVWDEDQKLMGIIIVEETNFLSSIIKAITVPISDVFISVRNAAGSGITKIMPFWRSSKDAINEIRSSDNDTEEKPDA